MSPNSCSRSFRQAVAQVIDGDNTDPVWSTGMPSWRKPRQGFRFGTSKMAPPRCCRGMDDAACRVDDDDLPLRFRRSGRSHRGRIGYDGGNPRGQTNGGKVTRPRAADDFATIRARVEELRRERTRMLADQKGSSPIGPRPYHRATTGDAEHQSDRLLPRTNQRTIQFP